MGYTNAQIGARVQKLKTAWAHRQRLQLAATRLRDAERERVWAIVAAHRDGVSVRNISAAIGLGRSRVQQLMHAGDADVALEELNRPVRQPSDDQTLRDRLAYESGLLRQAIGWLRDLGQKKGAKLYGKRVVVVNVNPEHRKREGRAFDYERVLRVLERMAGDLDAWGRGHDLPVIADDINQLRYDLAEPPTPTQADIEQELRAKYGPPRPRKG
jgi:hypothetical protein